MIDNMTMWGENAAEKRTNVSGLLDEDSGGVFGNTVNSTGYTKKSWMNAGEKGFLPNGSDNENYQRWVGIQKDQGIGNTYREGTFGKEGDFFDSGFLDEDEDAAYQWEGYTREEMAEEMKGTQMYVNIGNQWYKATVNDVFLSGGGISETRLKVDVEWDDPDGETMSFTVPATANRVRLMVDGPPPFREGGILRYKPFTDPQDAPHLRSVEDVLGLEQIFVNEKWNEVKSSRWLPGTMATEFTFSDGTTWVANSTTYNVAWRARGKIHTLQNPKDPKWDPEEVWKSFNKNPGWHSKTDYKQRLKDRQNSYDDDMKYSMKIGELKHLLRNHMLKDEKLRQEITRALGSAMVEDLDALINRAYIDIDKNQFGDIDTDEEEEVPDQPHSISRCRNCEAS